MTIRLSYYPDITQHRTPTEIREAVIVFANELQQELSRQAGARHTIEVLPVMSVAEQTSAAADERCEINLIKPSSYVYAHRRNPNVLPAAVALRTIDGRVGDTYFAQIYANSALGVRTFEELAAACRRDRADRPRLAFGDSFSTGNFLVPAALLTEKRCYPFTRFRSVEFFGGHDGAAKAVYEAKADVGAGHDGVIIDLARQPGFEDAHEKLIHIGRRDIHSDPVAVVVKDGTLRSAIENSLLAIAKLPQVERALDVFWGAVRGLGPTRHENYRSIEEAIDSLHIPEEDVLGV